MIEDKNVKYDPGAFYKLCAVSACTALLMLVSACCSERLFSEFQNTLYNNGNWVVTKTLLGKGVIGAFGFLGQPNTLSGGRLDLGKWHGFQEVLYKESVDPKEVSFDFLLGEDAYLALIFDKDKDGFLGTRLSCNKVLKSLVFAARGSGEFVSTQELYLPDLHSGAWNNCRVAFDESSASLFINNAFVGKFKVPALKSRQLGFRVGEKEALVDNVIIKSKDGRLVVRETFDPKISGRAFFYFLAGFIAINVLVIQLFRVSMPGLLVLNVGFAMGASLSLAFSTYFMLPRYPLSEKFIPRELRAAEKKYWAEVSQEAVCDRIAGRYMHESQQGVFRILFIGTSQCWGAGASNDSRTFVSLIEKALNRDGGKNVRYECINTGISGSDSSVLLELYAREWIKLGPRVVVIDLSYNDKDPALFARNLEQFARENASRKIVTLFVLEASSSAHPSNLLKMHEVMRNVGNKFGIQVLDLNMKLGKERAQGFLWWDSVHFTDFGHEFAARTILKALRLEIEAL